MAQLEGRDATHVATARERFLSAENVHSGEVRDTILKSWHRSKSLRVAADHIQLPYVKDPEQDTPLTRSAAPILRRLQDQLNDLPVSVILTDPNGVVLDRRTDDANLERYLDRVQLAPGFSYAEEFVGTNGIGTALEGLQPATVFGHEHYAESLDTLGCAGVPIRHPTSGQVLGLLDLTCWRKEAGPLLLTLAKATAKDIEHELTTQVGQRELSLFTEYLRACRRGHGLVFALDNDLVVTNEHAREVLSPQDQDALLARAAEAMCHREHVTLTVNLPSGGQARMSVTPVASSAGPAGGVVRAKLTRNAELPNVNIEHRPMLPGIVGSGAMWVHACHEITNNHTAGEWLLVEGEPGVGKYAVVKAVHARSCPTEPYTVIDFAARDRDGDEWRQRVRQALSEGHGTLVLRHIDALPDEYRPGLGRELSAASAGATPWVVATSSSGRERIGHDVLRHFPSSVTVPPLRHHIDDLNELVPFLLLQLSKDTRLMCARTTIQLLMRSSWPGNITQLRHVLHKVMLHRRSGTVQPDDLPPECRSVSRRVLTPLESMERDAIVQALLDAEGNKTTAARALGVSRATIYRKIREYGIDVPC
ncbi:sigma-54-dependent Fis family transcriptional regulator [Haloechinothrix halophila]|uniref:sigma-54-dependent Fis family transcriptional regulator n=1 Tax=Haloechinothrix halophila TaxID=1069073 RepID=UPI0004056649|nr:helix-turn-helix domain-containing protein [Haloechinothrix halophila]